MAKIPFLDKLAARIQRIDKDELLHVLTGVSREKAALESTLQALGDGILLLNTSGKILFANRAAASILGWDKKNVAGLPIAPLLRDAGLAEIFQGVCAQSAQALHREIQLYNPRTMLLSVDIIPIRQERQEILGIAALLRDITERRRIEERMVQTEKLGALSLLAAGLAHEIGNPLNSINIHLQLMGREIKKMKAARKVRKLNATVQEEIKRLDEIVHRYLCAIRPLKPKFEESSINNIIRDIYRLLKPEFVKYGIQGTLHLAESVSPTLLDPVHIKQALINLFKNAMQSMAKGGTLTVSTAMQDNAIRVQIRDSGTGIPPENLSKIFDPYFTTRENGSGLGLMMTHRIIQEHGGEITVRSQRGKGTEFTLILPLRSAHPKMLQEKIVG